MSSKKLKWIKAIDSYKSAIPGGFCFKIYRWSPQTHLWTIDLEETWQKDIPLINFPTLKAAEAFAEDFACLLEKHGLVE